jgi:hypothetical protein
MLMVLSCSAHQVHWSFIGASAAPGARRGGVEHDAIP